MTDTKQQGPESDPVKVVDRRWWVRAENEGSGAPTETPSLKPSYVEQLEQQLAEKDKRLVSYIEEYKKAEKEFEEARLRLRRDVSREVERGRRAVLGEFLEIIDSLDRALATATESSSLEAFVKGVHLVRNAFLSKLERLGVTVIPAAGLAFDPARHEAVSTIPTDDPTRDGLVLGVIAEGYQIGEDVLRPTRVAVGSFVGTPVHHADVKENERNRNRS